MSIISDLFEYGKFMKNITIIFILLFYCFNAALGEHFLCYLLQIVYPLDFSIFDEYNKYKENSYMLT